MCKQDALFVQGNLGKFEKISKKLEKNAKKLKKVVDKGET